MKKQLLLTLTLLLITATILVTGVAAHMPDISSSPEQATNAAFRDGMFVGKLDIQNGRKLHLSSGRWQADADRKSFIAGYHQALRENHPDVLQKLNASEMAAYREGVMDGNAHRQSSRPFRAAKTAPHATRAERQAYATGYQVGYYVPADENSVPVLRASRF
jgi:hypothetical protein